MELLITIAVIAFIIYAANNKKTPASNTNKTENLGNEPINNKILGLPEQAKAKPKNKEEVSSYLSILEATKTNIITESSLKEDESIIDVTDKYKRIDEIAPLSTIMESAVNKSEEKLPEQIVIQSIHLETLNNCIPEKAADVNASINNIVSGEVALIDEGGKIKTEPENLLNEHLENLKKQEELWTEKQQELINLLAGIKINISSVTVNDPIESSIIDVTDKYKRIDEIGESKTEPDVPHWPFKYIYSSADIEDANPEQQAFYKLFKENFLNGIFNDLKGNTNYAFVLLYDLLEEYKTHKEIPKLKGQCDQLAACYPQTKPYAINFLINRMEEMGDIDGIARIRSENKYYYQGYANEVYNYWGLGTKYKEKLSLSGPMVKILNDIYYGANNFYNIEFCRDQVIKTFVNLVNLLDEEYKKETTDRGVVFLTVTDIIATKHFKYKRNSNNYKYALVNSNNELFIHLLKHCENGVRETYGHKRRINVDFPYNNLEVTTVLEDKLLSKVKVLLPEILKKISLPDETTEMELNAQNTTRWKIRLEELEKNYKGKPEEFKAQVIELGRLNKKNPSCESIFFEASKFMAKYSKTIALALYLHYLYYDLKSDKFDNKPLTKSIQKSLFTTNEQLHEFEIILSRLIQDKNLEKALAQLPAVYEVKRKKIKLDQGSIKEVQALHSDTVNLLNEYLKDELEDENSTIVAQEINAEEVNIQITPKHLVQESKSLYVAQVVFTDIQIMTLVFFEKSNFSVGFDEMEIFAKSKGVFKNQLIESINETSYELLDDLLIEEEEDFYTINIEYYKSIKQDDK